MKHMRKALSLFLALAMICCACLCGRYGYRNRNGLCYDGNVHAGRI